MNKRIERCTLAAAMAVGTMALAGFLTAAYGRRCPRCSTRAAWNTSAAASAWTNPKP